MEKEQEMNINIEKKENVNLIDNEVKVIIQYAKKYCLPVVHSLQPLPPPYPLYDFSLFQVR